jgi:hypothetical protein
MQNQDQCENCGNQYDKLIQIIQNGHTHHFDSFECAINKLAPKCVHCETKIIGHGVEENGKMFCCVHCASHEGKTALKDRSN